MRYHVPVLLAESVNALKIKPNGTYLDLTFGGGGHSKEILKNLSDGVLIAFDADDDVLNNLIDDKRFVFINDNYRFFRNYLIEKNITQVDGILSDLGVSSHQLDDFSRGFSYRDDKSFLDMRMDKSAKTIASEILNNYEEKALCNIFRTYGELNNAFQISKLIIRRREISKIKTVADLVDAIKPQLPKSNDYKILSKIFQALRIEVNGELDALKEMLLQTPLILKPGGKLVVISYHSLEDKIVKNFMKSGNFEGELQEDFYGNKKRLFEIISKKPIEASNEEIETNSRARSAKMRIAEKNEIF